MPENVDLTQFPEPIREDLERDQRNWGRIEQEAVEGTASCVEEVDRQLAENPDDPTLNQLKESVGALANALPRAVNAMFENTVANEAEILRNREAERSYVADGYVEVFSRGGIPAKVVATDWEDMQRIKANTKKIVLVHLKNVPPVIASPFPRHTRGWSASELESAWSCHRGGPFSAIGDHMRREINYSEHKNEPWAVKLRELFPHDQTSERDYERNLGEYCYHHAEELGFVFLTRTISHAPLRRMIDEDLNVTDD